MRLVSIVTQISICLAPIYSVTHTTMSNFFFQTNVHECVEDRMCFFSTIEFCAEYRENKEYAIKTSFQVRRHRADENQMSLHENENK